MKKALLAAICFVLIGFMMVDGTFALPDLNDVFADLTSVLGDALGLPQLGGSKVDVSIVSDNTAQSLYPGSTATRVSHVHNDGTDNVYFRLAYAIQYNEDSWDQLTITFTPEEGLVQDPEGWRNTSVDGVPYKMMVFSYDKALQPGQDSPSVQLSISMDQTMTSEQISEYRSDFLRIQALAIDTESFREKYDNAEDALNLALPLTNLHPF